MCSIRDPNVSNVFARPKVTTNIFFIDFDFKSHLSLEIWIDHLCVDANTFGNMHAIAQANITMSLSETKPKKNAFLYPGLTRLAYFTTLTSWCFLLKQVVGSIMASHPRFSPSSTSSSSKCPPRPRASRDQHHLVLPPSLLCSALDHIDKRPQ